MDLQSPIYKQGYGMIPKIPMRDTRLSPEAKAIYAYLCAFAGNDGTAYPSAELMCKELGMSTQHRFFKHRKQLEELGYISVQRPRLSNGRLGQVIYVINEDPEHMGKPHAEFPHMEKPHVEIHHVDKSHVDKPHMEKPHADKPHVENPHDYINNSLTNNSLTSTSQISNSLTNTPHTPQGGQDAQVEEAQPVKAEPEHKRSSKKEIERADDWERWYAAYPRHDNKQGAIKAWNTAHKKGVLPSIEMLLDTLSWQKQRWTDPQFIPMPSSYLNGRRWQDERPAPQPVQNAQAGYPCYQPTGKLQGMDLHNANMEAARIALARINQAKAEGKAVSPFGLPSQEAINGQQ